MLKKAKHFKTTVKTYILFLHFAMITTILVDESETSVQFFPHGLQHGDIYCFYHFFYPSFQFLSVIHWCLIHMFLYSPKKKKSEGVISGLLAGHSLGPPLPIHWAGYASWLTVDSGKRYGPMTVSWFRAHRTLILGEFLSTSKNSLGFSNTQIPTVCLLEIPEWVSDEFQQN